MVFYKRIGEVGRRRTATAHEVTETRRVPLRTRGRVSRLGEGDGERSIIDFGNY